MTTRPSHRILLLLGLSLALTAGLGCRTPRPSVPNPPPAPGRNGGTDGGGQGSGGQGGSDTRPAEIDMGLPGTQPDMLGVPETEPPVVTPDPCQPGFHSCNSVCVESRLPANCGLACDPCPTVAGGTATCDGTKCGVSCPPGQKPCDDKCIEENRPCDGCKDGKNECGGICVAATDKTACGKSCAVCPTSAYGVTECDGNGCLLTCNPGYHRCGNKCLADNDATACGASCQVCPGVGNGVPTCANGACAFRCSEGFRVCGNACIPPGQPCNGSCVSGRQLCGPASCVPSNQVTAETCDGKDNDCDGTVDEGLVEDCSNKCTKATRTCSNGKWDASKCPAAVQCCGDSDCGTCKECRAGACVNQGTGQDKKAECGGQGCNVGRCNVCTPNQKVCDGNALKTCAADGSRWNVDNSCVSCTNLTCNKCVAAAETCNGRDDDCDGRIDEDLAPRPCNPSCAGTQACRNGGWDASTCARTDQPTRCGATCASCPASGGGTPTCNNGVCGVSCPGGKLCDGRCVPNAQLCNGMCNAIPCRGGCIPASNSCAATKPLKLFWGNARLDNYSVGHPQGESNARNAGYGEAGTIGHIERTQLPGTVALKCFYNAADPDNLVTTGGAPSGYSPCNLGDGNVEGYIYTTQRPGTIALKQWYSAERNEYHAVTSQLQSDQALLGQNYVIVRTEGYVYSQPQ